jgi:hypothetical protein
MGCNQDPTASDVDLNQPGSSVSNDNLLQDWTRSYEEEDQVGMWQQQIFRPAGSREFSPSWFRMQYSFRGDGACEWLVLHPLDAHYTTQGTWKRDPQDERTILISGGGADIEPISFRIIELHEDLLRIEALPR